MFLLASLKMLTNSKNCSKSRIKFLFQLSFALIVSNNFHDNRRLSEQLL
jgi:hypothetical protein